MGGAIRHGQLKLDGGGSDIRASNECPPCSEGPSTPTTPSKSVASVTVSHASVQNGGRDLDLSLTVSGVMSRREDLPHPSPHSINRVFKVVFLGKVASSRRRVASSRRRVFVLDLSVKC